MAKRDQGKSLVQSFKPIAAPDARVLILGTAPSIMSLAKQQYYGHPQNAFWRIMGELFGARRELDYAERKEILCDAGVAVWDVLRECQREGSLDSAIRRDSERAHDLVGFLRRHPLVHTVFFNGTKSETAYRQHVRERVERLGRKLDYARLPSTSPAHAGRSFAEKLEAWQAVRRAVEEGGRMHRGATEGPA